MSFGAPTPIEIVVAGPSLPESEAYAHEIVEELKKVDYLRDVQLGELLEYPSMEINVDRTRAAQLGVTVEDVGKALAPATWSSRFMTPIYWADPKSGIAYQVQVEIPQSMISSIEDVSSVLVKNSQPPTRVGDVADVTFGQAVGEYHRYNMQHMVTVTANVGSEDLGRAAADVRAALSRLPSPPRGVTVNVPGQVGPMELMLDSLELGLLLSIVAVFLLLAGYFQSIRVAFVVISAIPSVLAGVALALLLTGVTLNIQSFMGAIMAVGVSVANSILLVTFAEHYRRRAEVSSVAAAVEASRSRMRPILMTSVVMIAGMTPLALGAAQTAPLGIAVIGGLIASTATSLTVIPSIFAVVQRKASVASFSIDPEDPESPYFGAPTGSSAV